MNRNQFTSIIMSLTVMVMKLSPTFADSKIDPIRFSIGTSATQVSLNEEFEIKISAQYLNIPSSVAFVFEGSNSFKLKLISPAGFVQTGGDFQNFTGTELTKSKPSVSYILRGKFVSSSDNGTFQLLRSHKNSDNQSTFIEVGRLSFTLKEGGEIAQNNPEARIMFSSTPGYIPYMTMAQLRVGLADSAKVVYINEAGKSGVFAYDSSNTISPDDSAMVLRFGSKRYIRQYDDAISVMWFGTHGNGISDDTKALKKALKFIAKRGGNLVIPTGTYIINLSIPNDLVTVEDTIKNVSITGYGSILKTKKGFAAFSLRGHTGCDISIVGVTILGSRDSEIDEYDWIPNNIYVPSSARTSNNSYGIFLKKFKNALLDKITVKSLHGRGLILDSTQFASVNNSFLTDISRAAIEVPATVEVLSVTACKIVDVGIFKDSFSVSGVMYQFDNDPSGKVWYTDVGDCVNSNAKVTMVTNCYFRNFNRMGICVDPGSSSTINIYLLSDSNIFETDHHKLRCSNPQASIWLENGQTGIITNNTIRYIRRAVSEELPGYAIVGAVSLRENVNFVIEGNKIYTDNYNKSQMGGIKTVNNSGTVSVKNNQIIGKYYANIYHGNVTKGTSNRILDKLIIESNYCSNSNVIGQCFVLENVSNDGIHLNKMYVTNNIFSQVTKNSVNVFPYAIELNKIEGNDLGGTMVDLRFAAYSKNNFFFKNNLNVGGMLAKNGNSGEINYMYISDNHFVGNLNLSATSGVNRVSGTVENNLVNGNVYLRSVSHLSINNNQMKALVFDNDALSSSFIDIKNNRIRVVDNTSGISFKNSNQFSYSNVNILNNTILPDSAGIVNTKGITFVSNTGGKLNVNIDNNIMTGLTVKEVNTGHKTPTEKIVTGHNFPPVAANSYITVDISLECELGQKIDVFLDKNLEGMKPLSGYVSAPGTVKIFVENPTATAIDLPAGTLIVRAN